MDLSSPHVDKIVRQTTGDLEVIDLPPESDALFSAEAMGAYSLATNKPFLAVFAACHP